MILMPCSRNKLFILLIRFCAKINEPTHLNEFICKLCMLKVYKVRLFVSFMCACDICVVAHRVFRLTQRHCGVKCIRYKPESSIERFSECVDECVYVCEFVCVRHVVEGQNASRHIHIHSYSIRRGT